VWALLNVRNIFFQIQNLEHKYGTTRTQLPKKTNEAQSSIKKRLIPPKDIGSQTLKKFHNPGPIMSPCTYITFSSKLAKET
jgi:hypothetical protein